MTSKKGIIGIIAAILAGIGIGILIAPDKGKQTRKDLLAKLRSIFK